MTSTPLLLVAIVLALCLAVVGFLAFRWRREVERLIQRYAAVEDVDAERLRVLGEIDKLKAEMARFEGDYQQRKNELVADADAERQRILSEIDAFQGEMARFEREYQKRKDELVSDATAERQKIRKDVDSLQAEISKLDTDFYKKKQGLTQKYDKATRKYERLLKEINTLEESLEMMDFGVYRPHYDYTTSEQYKQALEALREREKKLIRDERAVICRTEWSVGGSKAEGRKMTKQTHKLMLRAFNGECDAALAKVRWDNILKMEERMRKSVEAINKSAEVNQSYISEEFVRLKIDELRLTHEYQEKIQEEKEEQKRIQEQIREEQRAAREFKRAQEEAEKEEARYEKALAKAREDLQKASGAKVDALSEKIAQLEEALAKAEENKQRAISMAQMTKAGHVYIISNIGSFGEDVFKIGMTRRLEPMDRVKELGDASVPFEFDVHAMIYSENAPDLERRLHSEFAELRVNLVNPRKEFFHVSLANIEKWAQRENFPITLTKVAEARAYRESLEIRKNGQAKTVGDEFAHQVPNLFDDEDDGQEVLTGKAGKQSA